MDNVSSNYSNFENIESWNNGIAKILLPDTVIVTFYLLVGLIGNASVIIVYGAWINQSEKEDRFMIPVLAVCDLLASVIISSFHITLNMKPVTFSNNSACKALCYMNGFLTYLSIFILLIIAIQRYYKLCKPLKQSKITTSVLKKLIMCAILSTAVLASPIAFFYGSTKISQDGTDLVGFKCKRRTHDGYNSYFKIYGTLLVLILIVAIITFSTIYIKIGKQLYLHFTKRKHHKKVKERPEGDNCTADTNSYSDSNTAITNSRNSTSTSLNTTQQTNVKISEKSGRHNRILPVRRKEQTMLKVTIIFLVITFLFILCYVPRVITLMIEGLSADYWNGLSDSQFAALVFVHQIYLINNIVNPVVYAFMDNCFRDGAKRLLKKCC